MSPVRTRLAAPKDKMKIAIYGDSFANNVVSLSSKPWMKILADTNRSLQITNYGEAGSSLWYSYRKYLDTYQNYDRHIFLITSDERFTLNKNLPVKHIAGWATVSTLIKDGKIPDNKESQRLNNFAQGMYEFLDPQFFNDVSNCLYRHLLSMNNANTLFLPCFEHMKFKELNHRCSLFHISELDWIQYGLNTWAMALGDLRNCHMNPENNQILADKIYNWISNNTPVILKLEDFVTSKLPKNLLFKEYVIP